MNNYTGEMGGMIAGAAMAAWALSTAFWFAVAGTIWRLFFVPRLKQLEANLSLERTRCDEELAEFRKSLNDERARFEREADRMRGRINQLETLLMLHGPQQLRQQMQVALSEQHLELERRVPNVRKEEK